MIKESSLGGCGKLIWERTQSKLNESVNGLPCGSSMRMELGSVEKESID